MARRKRKSKKTSIQFHLSLTGLFGLGMVCFCIFLWMFLLGIWAGQTILLPAADAENSFALNKLAGFLPAKEVSADDTSSANDSEQSAEENATSESANEPSDLSEPSFFSLQVGAFRDPQRAGKAKRNWKAKGYDAFTQSSDDSENSLCRVFIGKFENLAEANDLAARLEKKENTKAYIALLPASKIRIP